jgi:hypothetical protein
MWRLCNKSDGMLMADCVEWFGVHADKQMHVLIRSGEQNSLQQPK